MFPGFREGGAAVFTGWRQDVGLRSPVSWCPGSGPSLIPFVDALGDGLADVVFAVFGE